MKPTKNNQTTMDIGKELDSLYDSKLSKKNFDKKFDGILKAIDARQKIIEEFIKNNPKFPY